MKYLSCREAGKDCNYVAHGKTADEVLKDAAEHGKRAHGMKDTDFTPEMVNRMRTLVREEGAQPRA